MSAGHEAQSWRCRRGRHDWGQWFGDKFRRPRGPSPVSTRLVCKRCGREQSISQIVGRAS